MKKILSLLLSSIILFSACKKEVDKVFDESFDERVNGSLTKYQAVLTSAQYGWKALITTDHGNGGTYAFYMKFNDSSRVTMVSDFDTISAVTPQASSYRLRQQQQPTLIFDTYSYVHVLADPNENVVVYSDVNGGPVGQGLLSDFEFIINPDDIVSDTIKFTGKVNGAKLVMTKATAEEAGLFLGGQWVLLDSYLTQKLLTYYKRIPIGGVDYDLYNDPLAKTLTFQKVDGTNVVIHTTGYYNTINGIVLYDPLPAASGSVSQISVDSWDPANSTLNVQVGSENTTIKETIFPLEGALQTAAPQEWWNIASNNATYWRTWTGFHVDGVDDAFNLASLTTTGRTPGTFTYYYFVYYPDYSPGNADLLGPVFIDPPQTGLALVYAAAPAVPTWAANGIQQFILLGNYNTTPRYPTDPANPATMTKDLFFQPQGFYFVKINDTNYDMVSAANGRAWLRWELQP